MSQIQLKFEFRDFRNYWDLELQKLLGFGHDTYQYTTLPTKFASKRFEVHQWKFFNGPQYLNWNNLNLGWICLRNN
jgi:hypothetical protein